MRILCLLPSATEIVYALGSGSEVVGVSHECDFPLDVKDKPVVTEPLFDSGRMDSGEIDRLVREYAERGEKLYGLRLGELRRLKPDLIITQELCDVCAVGADDVSAALGKVGAAAEIVTLKAHSLEDVEEDIRRVGEAVDHPLEAKELVEQLEIKRRAVMKLTSRVPRVRVFSAEWLNPLMNAGHWIPEMVECAGGVEGLADKGMPSKRIDWSRVVEYDPEVMVLMPCGMDARRGALEVKHLTKLDAFPRLSAVRKRRVFAVDANNYFSRPGPRLFDGLMILAQMFHAELFDLPLKPEFAVRVDPPHATVRLN